ncbi:TonB family protein [Peristeroidobacter agariperforans]|uniref:TonB family protein n=1 Tax=Peristeroidobacter agariperforans TaxID=268404 RepID=UPI00101C2E57|nr:TonB family protein [Peristeroidobacter agariperforans]
MRSTRPDDFLNTVRTTAARPGQIIDVVVLTSDAGLLEALRSSAGSEHALWDVPSADAAVDYLVGGRCDVLIVDLGSLHGDVTSLLERLQAQFPELIFMATGRREEESGVASLLSTGQIYRFLHKPISPGRAFQFLNAATRRYNELADIQPVALQAVRTIARKRPYLGKAIAAGSGVLAAVMAFAIWWHSRDQGLPATLQTTQVSDAPVEDQVKSKLGSAQIAYLSGRLIDPRGDNALQYYRDVLSLDANNADAEAGVQKVIHTLEQRVVKALEERSAPRVVTAWTALQRAAPSHPRLDALRAQLLALSRAAPKPPQVAARPSAAPAAAAQLATPTADAVAAAAIAEQELADAIARELAEQETAANAPPIANAPPVEQVAEANNESAAPAVEIQPQEPAPEQQASVLPDQDFAQAASLKRIREVPPVYPREAQRSGTEGWVQVEFTIAPDGSTRDLQVRDSAPTQVFDKAALDSVGKWRFEPVRKNGAPVAQRAVLQVRFVLNN